MPYSSTRMSWVAALRPLCSIALAVGAVIASPAQADDAPRASQTAALLGRDLALIDRVLLLDESQRPIVEALLRDQLDAGASAANPDEFFLQVAAILTDAQHAKLPELVRALQRDRLERTARIAGENVHPIALANRTMRGDVVEGLDRIADEYDRDLAQLLLARGDAPATDSSDQLAIRVQIRTLNDLTVERVAEILPEATRLEYRTSALAAGYPTAYAPSGALEGLRSLLKDLPLAELQSLESEAAGRLDAIRARGVTAVRARDAARLSDDATKRAAHAAIESAEKEYESFEFWVLESITGATTPEQLAATEAGRAIAERAKLAAMAGQHDWNDAAATTARFDRDGNGTLSNEESSRILDVFARSVGKRSKWQL